LNPTAIFSKTGKGVQEASGKTSHLSRADRAVLKEIDGKTVLGTIAGKFEKISADKFYALIQQFDDDGYVREVSSGTQPAAPSARSAPAAKAPPPQAGGDDMDFTQVMKVPPRPEAPKGPPVDLAAAARAEAERKAKEQQAFDYKARQEAEQKAKAEAEAKAKAEARAKAEAKARAEAEAKARAEAEAKARAEAEGRARADAEARVKAARDAAIRMATEAKAKAEADAKAKSDAAAEREREALEKARKEAEDKARMEAELTGKLEQERKAREDAERRAKEAAELARKEMEERAKREADEMRQRLEAEMKAKLEEERKAREEEDRKRREEEDRKRREEDERRRKEEEARRAKEDEERRAREEADRKRREEDERRRKEEEERRAKEDAERREHEAAERKRREEEDRKRAEDEKRRNEDDERRAKDDAERRAREEADREADRKRRDEEDRKRSDEERRAKEDADRRAKDDADRRAKEDADRRAKEDADRRAKEDAERAAQSSSTPSVPPVAAAPAGSDIGDSLLADLDSFGQREEEEQPAKEEAERKAKEEAARKAKAEAERKAKEEADKKRREEEEQRRKEEEQRRKEEEEREAQEAEEQRAREEAEREKEEEADRKRKIKDAERKSAQRAAAAKRETKDDDDIGVTDDDLDMDDIKKDQKALSATARKAAREQAVPVSTGPVHRPKKWGKPAAIALFVLLVGGIGVLNVMPVSTADYEKAASEAMGVPVKIASARLSVLTGVEARFEGVSVGDSVKIKLVRGFPEIGSLFGAKKSFSRIELEGVALSQAQLAEAVLGKIGGENFRVGRVIIKQAKFDGPLTLPPLDVEATVSGDGSLQSVSLRGGDKLNVQLSPKGSEVGVKIDAGSLTLPFTAGLLLSEFSMKGTATRDGVTMSEFDGRAFDGVVSGTAKIRWGANWQGEGEVRARGVRVAVIAPALVSEGKLEGRAAYSMSGANPATLFETARMQGEFKIEKGVLGSFDLTRALQTGGSQSAGRTIFSELTGQAVYDKGSVKVSNVAITAGAMNAGATLEVDAGGGLSGRVVADVKTPNQTLRATLNVSGKLQDPVIRK